MRDCSPQRRKRPAPSETNSQPFAVGSEPFLVSSDINVTQSGVLPSIRSEYSSKMQSPGESSVSRRRLRKLPSIAQPSAQPYKLKSEAFFKDNMYHIAIYCQQPPVPKMKSTAMIKAVPTAYNKKGMTYS